MSAPASDVEWVLAVERAYVAAATATAAPAAPAPVAPDAGDPQGVRPAARAAACAVASHYLAVGTPRTFGLVADAATTGDAVLSLAAHRAWFAPREIRCAGAGADALAARTGGVATPLAEALACDIVCIHVPVTLRATQLRRGTHVNLLSPLVAIDADLGRIATVVNELPGLGALAAGLIDGRQLDEITLFWLGDAAIAAAALASAPSRDAG